MTWCQEKICRSRIKVMWVDIYQDYVIVKSRDHDIKVLYLLLG